MTAHAPAGLFISFEGVDGAGKTTQVERLRAYLTGCGRRVVVTREPGGTELGVQLRRMLLHGGDIAPRTEALLFAADRAQHVAQVIAPALEQGAVVITDRYLDSSLAYQAGGRELTADDVRDLSMWATGGLLPQRTYLLDVDPTVSHRRLARGEDRMEAAGADFQRRTREEFLRLAAADPKRFLVVDASVGIGDVWHTIQADIRTLLGAASGPAAAIQAADAGIRQTGERRS
ncbi:dTMP kinase [Bifidobacterium thermophilum]|uniref:dTMP kinase n=1 Tax=Bifidobacterium thermophilum TaxID=33905 RepID=UPI003095CD02